MKYRHKLIKCGGVWDLYSYEKEIRTGKDAPGRQGGRKKQPPEWLKIQKNRSDALYRAKKEVFRQANTNSAAWGETTKFMTLTYRENVGDLKESNKVFKRFIQRLNYKLDIKLKYTVVVQFQDRGAVHYHLLCYNLPYTAQKLLRELWLKHGKGGTVNIKKIDHVDNIGAYITRYMVRSCDDDRLLGNKCYFSSRGLKEPEEIIISDEEKETLLKSHGKNVTYEKQFENEFCGKIEKLQFNMNANHIITK